MWMMVGVGGLMLVLLMCVYVGMYLCNMYCLCCGWLFLLIIFVLVLDVLMCRLMVVYCWLV